jgi:hypothetical protein
LFEAWQIVKEKGDTLRCTQSSGGYICPGLWCLFIKNAEFSFYYIASEEFWTSSRLSSSQELLWSLLRSFCIFQLTRVYYCMPSVVSSPYHHSQSATFWVTAFLRKFCQTCPFLPWIRPSGFNFFLFRSSIFFTDKVFSLASNPRPGEPGNCIYVPQWQGGPVKPQVPGSLFIALYTTRRAAVEIF